MQYISDHFHSSVLITRHLCILKRGALWLATGLWLHTHRTQLNEGSLGTRQSRFAAVFNPKKRFYCCSLSSEGAEDVKKKQVRHIDFSEKRIPIKSIIYIYPAKSCASSTDRNTRKKHYQFWLKWWTDVINSRKILIFFFEPQRMVKCTFGIREWPNFSRKTSNGLFFFPWIVKGLIYFPWNVISTTASLPALL